MMMILGSWLKKRRIFIILKEATQKGNMYTTQKKKSQGTHLDLFSELQFLSASIAFCYILMQLLINLSRLNKDWASLGSCQASCAVWSSMIKGFLQWQADLWFSSPTISSSLSQFSQSSLRFQQQSLNTRLQYRLLGILWICAVVEWRNLYRSWTEHWQVELPSQCFLLCMAWEQVQWKRQCGKCWRSTHMWPNLSKRVSWTQVVQ